MRTITMVQNMTLDGVMQAPGRPDEDTRNDFADGGWAAPSSDHVLGQAMGQHMAKEAELLFGRRTYEDFASFWPTQADNPFTPVLTARTKYVVTNTLEDPLPWDNSTALHGDPVEAVTALKADDGLDLVILGSGHLVGALLPAGLVDTMLLLVHPLTLGTGRRLFPTEGERRDLELVDSVTTTTTGVIVAMYQNRSTQT